MTMDSKRAGDWLTLAANFSVIIGIAFLILEIRQNSDIATAQVRLDYAAGWRSIDEQRQNEAFAQVYAKSILRPEELSLSEVIQLDGYYTGVMDQMLSAYTSSKAGLRSGQFEETAQHVANGYFSNVYAQAWWQEVRMMWQISDDSEFQNIMDSTIARTSQQGNREYYQGILNSLSLETEGTNN